MSRMCSYGLECGDFYQSVNSVRNKKGDWFQRSLRGQKEGDERRKSVLLSSLFFFFFFFSQSSQTDSGALIRHSAPLEDLSFPVTSLCSASGTFFFSSPLHFVIRLKPATPRGGSSPTPAMRTPPPPPPPRPSCGVACLYDHHESQPLGLKNSKSGIENIAAAPTLWKRQTKPMSESGHR